MKYKILASKLLKHTRICLGLLIVPFALLILLVGCGKDRDIAYIEPYYEMDLTFDRTKVDLVQKVMYQNNHQHTLTSLAFHLYPNAFKQDAIHSPFDEKDRNLYHTNGIFGKIDVLSVKINGLNCDFVISGDDDTILELPCILHNGDVAIVEMVCRVDLPLCNHRLGQTPHSTNVTGFYPILCFYDGQWRKDNYHHFGDPFLHDSATYDVTVHHPKEYSVAGSGTRTVNDVSTLAQTCFHAENIRDFALVFSKDFSRHSTTTSNGVLVEYFAVTDSAPTQTLNTAVSAVETFSNCFGDYAHSTYTLVESPMAGGGMEYGALSILADTSQKVIVHETAHQWWYDAVGNDQINESWLDEGLAEFSSIYYHHLLGDKDTFIGEIDCLFEESNRWHNMSVYGFDGRLNKPLTEFLTVGEYVATAYVDGALTFEILRQMMGDERFALALQQYYRHNMFSVADVDDLKTAFEQYFIGAGRLIDSIVEGKMLNL